MLKEQFSYNTEATLLKFYKQIEESLRFASGIHYAKIKIMPPHPWINFP